MSNENLFSRFVSPVPVVSGGESFGKMGLEMVNSNKSFRSMETTI
jgi:hypothetical protein